MKEVKDICQNGQQSSIFVCDHQLALSPL